MRFTVLSLTLLLLVSPDVAWAESSTLSLRLLREDSARATESLEMQPRLARIDALAALLPTSSHPDSLRSEVGRLLAGSSLMKHRIEAIEWSLQHDDPDALSALRDLAHRYQRVFNPWDARLTLQRLVKLHPERAAAHRAQGIFLLDRGLEWWNERDLAAAVESYERAVGCDDAGADDWRGLCSALVATGRMAELHDAASTLLTFEERDASGQLYAGVAFETRGLHATAEAYFRAAIAQLSADETARFYDLEGFLEQFRPVIPSDSMLERNVPAQILAWWVRLVESEVMFGDPGSGLHGWDSAPGQVYLMFGRPLRQAYYHNYSSPGVGEVTALLTGGAHHDELANALGSGIGSDGVWIWILQAGDREFPYVFQKGAAFARWTSSIVSETRYLEPVREAVPFALWVEPAVATDLQLHARHAAFLGSAGRMRAESYVGVVGALGIDPSDLRVRHTILDDAGERLEERTVPLTQGVRRTEVLASLGIESEADAALAQLSALLPVGRYVVRVAVEDQDGAFLAATEQAFHLRRPSSGLFMSDLELADSFHELAGRRDVPPSFVKYANVIVPHPEYGVAEQETVYVYYEVYGASVDPSGTTRLDVLYEVFPRQSFSMWNAGLAQPPTGGERPVVRLEFPGERTGISAQGAVVKGTAIDLTELKPGHYVLAVTVRQAGTVGEAQRFLFFARD